MTKQERRKSLLGMNHSTAKNRLIKDILWKFVQTGGHKCHHCGAEMARETFSIEHKESWTYADDPLKAFFDLDNIAFSHQRCNFSDGAKNQWKVIRGKALAQV